MARRILVAEDSRTQAMRVQILLEGEGYEVTVAADGREGLRCVQAAPPDLIISDIVMPEMDGYAFCQAVKSDEARRRIPFVLLTGQNTAEDILRGLEYGADNFIPKPFEDDYLLERVRRIFEHLDLRHEGGQLEVKIPMRVGDRDIFISAGNLQIIELLFSTFEELARVNARLVESQRIVEEYAKSLEVKVQERTEQLLQAEKLAAMGQLLASMAHELNNPLSVVNGHTFLLRKAAKDGPLAERAAKIGEAAERCTRIVNNFLGLARRRPPERQMVKINEVIEEAVELLSYELRVENVEVILTLATDLPSLWADPHQLHQVVVNLVSNAHHAMRQTPPPRRITLTSRFDSAKERVSLEVADTGPGIPPEIRSRIFQAFFTTKPPGQGTGLGLSLCQGIIENHGGTIAVESEHGHGAIFRIDLPVEPAPQAAAGEVAPPPALPPLRGKTILVVDDEPEIVAVLTEMLSTDGQLVETAANGARALDKLRGRSYDLIVTDIKMPELDGLGLWRELERRDSGLLRRIIFVTGDTLGSETKEFLKETGVPCLTKPFVEDEVLAAVQRALRAE